jgi:TatD DNase family protein
MTLIDVHAHLGAEDFDADRREVIERARANGIGRIVAVGETLTEAEQNLALAKEYPGAVLAAAGLYPTLVDLEQATELIDFIRRSSKRLVAIGEVGLDHWKVQDEKDREIQREIFGRFIKLGVELALPLNVHSRSAGRKAIELLNERNAGSVLMHAFDGRASAALQGVDAGYFFSIPPSVVRSKQKQKLVRQLPLESILLETDSPVLGPTPNERNEPANLLVSLRAVAEIKGLSEEAVAEAVIENQRKLFARTEPIETEVPGPGFKFGSYPIEGPD